MSRARDLADKFSGGTIIQIESVADSNCRDKKETALNVKENYGRCIFSIENEGVIYQYHAAGVKLVGKKGGFRVLADGSLSTTNNGGSTWKSCCEMNYDSDV